LHVADGFTSSPKKVVLWIFIAPNNPSLSAGFEPANLGSIDKHDKHRLQLHNYAYYTTVIL
jgi:hypothetical protein